MGSVSVLGKLNDGGVADAVFSARYFGGYRDAPLFACALSLLPRTAPQRRIGGYTDTVASLLPLAPTSSTVRAILFIITAWAAGVAEYLAIVAKLEVLRFHTSYQFLIGHGRARRFRR